MPRLIPSLLAASLLLLTSCAEFFSKPPPGCFDNQPVRGLSQVENPDGLPYVPGQLLVSYHEPSGLHPQSRLSIAAAVQASFQLTILQDGGGYGPDLVQVPPGQDARAMAALLSADPRVKYAEPNYYLRPLGRPNYPNDTELYRQWNMLEFGLREAWAAWALETGSDSVTIAIIDTGVDTRHEDLAGKSLPGCDFYGGDDDPNPGNATNTHGTHVAGIAAATGNNGVGVAGVAYRGVRVLPVKVSDNYGYGSTVDRVAEAIRWSAGLQVNGVNRNPHPARIINISLGAPRTNQVLNEAVAEARGAGAIVVAAAGNVDGNVAGAGGITTPANAPGAVAVGSVDGDFQRSSFSRYDATGVRTVDVMAPGGVGPEPPPVVDPTGVLSTIPGNQYGYMRGTSMAAPFVAGVAALVWSQHPGWTAEQVIAQLKATAYFDTSRWNRNEYGYGVVCADAALGAPTTCGR